MRISGVTFSTRKTHKTRNTIVTILIILLLAVISIVLISAYNAWTLIHPEIQSIEEFSSNIVPEYRDINIKSSDKTIILNGWFFQTKNSEKTVIIAHSHGKNRLEFGTETIELYKALLAKGYNVFAFDMRYSGKSGGKNSTLGSLEKDDVLAAVNYVKQQGARHVFLMGFSTGASACLMAAEEDSSIEAVIADTPYAKLNQYVDGFLNTTALPKFPFNITVMSALDTMAGINNENSSPNNKIGDLAPCNVLFIHSKTDTFVHLEDNRPFYSEYENLNNGITELWETDVEGHAQSYPANTSDYMEKVTGFLGQLEE